MDDAEFLAELEQMERTGEVRSAPQLPFAVEPHSTVDDLDEGLVASDNPFMEPVEDPKSPTWAIEGYEQTPAPPAFAVRDVAVAVIGFVLMMAVGAAGAALIFHDRVAVLFR